MTTEHTIPLHRLVHSAANVRHTGRTDGIAELAASIAAHGLRQNLNVVPSPDGQRYEVVAGARRLRALKRLAKAGTLPRNASIPCLVLAEGDDPTEISLAENAMRTAMHPDDQYEAFRHLVEDTGLSVEDVAARFGVSDAVVRRRLKLAHVSPRLRTLFRKGEMGLDHVMALALVDDHTAQEAAWKSLPEWNRDPSALKRLLTQEAVPASDKLAQLVGLDAYVAAGGGVLRDLFDAHDTGYLTDRALLERLAAAKMEDAVTAVQAEGWKWVMPETCRDYGVNYGRVYPEADAEGGKTFAAEDMARAGAKVILQHDGSLAVERGLIHPDDVRKEAKTERAESGPAGLSAVMVEELTAHRTAALRIELAHQPAVALAAIVHALALPILYHCGSGFCLTIRAASEPLERHTQATDDCAAYRAMAEEGERWGDRLPGDAGDLFAWCLAQSQDVLLDLLAFLAALTVDAVRLRHHNDRQRVPADGLADALGLDMRQWWTPTIDGFYRRLPKAALALAVAEAKVPPLGVSLASIAKTEAARLAAKALTGSGWLPEALRSAPVGGVARE